MTREEVDPSVHTESVCEIREGIRTLYFRCECGGRRVLAMATKEKEGRREGTAKAHVADQISQAVQSTSNLLLLMHQSSPSQVASLSLSLSRIDIVSFLKNPKNMPNWSAILSSFCHYGLASVLKLGQRLKSRFL